MSRGWMGAIAWTQCCSLVLRPACDRGSKGRQLCVCTETVSPLRPANSYLSHLPTVSRSVPTYYLGAYWHSSAVVILALLLRCAGVQVSRYPDAYVHINIHIYIYICIYLGIYTHTHKYT